MANTNTGSELRWENGGIFRVIIDPDGTPAEHEFLLVRKGTLTFQPALPERILVMDRGQFTGQVKEGDERVSTISITTGLGITTFDTFLELLTDDASAGDVPLFNIEIEFATGTGVSTTEGVRFTDCFLPDGPQFQSGGAGADDDVSFTINSLDPKATFYTPS